VVTQQVQALVQQLLKDQQWKQKVLTGARDHAHLDW